MTAETEMYFEKPRAINPTYSFPWNHPHLQFKENDLKTELNHSTHRVTYPKLCMSVRTQEN